MLKHYLNTPQYIPCIYPYIYAIYTLCSTPIPTREAAPIPPPLEGGGGVQTPPKKRDVFYEQPLACGPEESQVCVALAPNMTERMVMVVTMAP